MGKKILITRLSKVIEEKEDYVERTMVNFTLQLKKDLLGIVEDRVYSAYKPIYYKRTYTFKNSIKSRISLEKDKNKTRIVSKTFFDFDSMYSNSRSLEIVKRIDEVEDLRVKRIDGTRETTRGVLGWTRGDQHTDFSSYMNQLFDKRIRELRKDLNKIWSFKLN